MYNCSDKFERLVESVAWAFHNNLKACNCNVIVGAEYKNVRCCRRTVNMDSSMLCQDLHSLLINKINQLGGVGVERNGNTLGYCAEIHAANGVLKQRDASGITLSDIKFSNSFRPRNMMPNSTSSGVICYCQNCLDTFNIHN